MLCDKLSDDDHKVRELGYSSFLRFRFEHEGGGHIQTLTAYQYHGSGGAGTTDGYATTKYGKKKANFDADIYFFGHDHKRDFTELPPIIRLSRDLKLQESKRFMVFPGSYLKTLNDDVYPNYAEAKGLPPSPIGCKRVEVEFTTSGYEIRDAS